VELACPESLPMLPAEAQVAIYRMVQEALTNVARHAQAQHVRVRVALESHAVRVRVEDDGQGVHGEVTPHLGLLGMRERVTALGGTLTVQPAPRSGLRVEAVIPREAAA
jgi:signal transduction histidine kinase